MGLQVQCKITPQNTIPPVYYLFLALDIDGTHYLDQIMFEEYKCKEHIHYSKLEDVVNSLSKEEKNIIEYKTRQTIKNYNK